MPSLTQPPSKKRRRDGEVPCHHGGVHHLAFSQDFDPYHPSPRRIFSPMGTLTKKLRLSSNSPIPSTPLAPSSRHNRSPSATAKPSSPLPAGGKPTTTPSQRLLSPCHICHRRPTKKAELDSYADCEGCGARTCYICMRACLGTRHAQLPTPITATHSENGYDDDDDEMGMRDDEVAQRGGWRNDANGEDHDRSFSMEDAPGADDDGELDNNSYKRIRGAEIMGPLPGGATWAGGGTGHRGHVCSQCCIEEGSEGEVVCLGCLGT